MMDKEFDLSMVTVRPEDELNLQKAKLTSGSIYKGVDCCTVLTATTAARIKAAGYEFVMRYIGKSNFTKNIKTAELSAIKAAGLMCGFVFETTAGRALSGASAGAADGAIAKAAADLLALPASVAISFAVDTDTSDFDTIEAYAKAFAKALGNHPCGVYGSYKVIEAMKARGACQHFWQTYAWSYGKLSRSAHVYQHSAGRRADRRRGRILFQDFTARSIREPKARTISITATKAIFVTQRIRNRTTNCRPGRTAATETMKHEFHRQPV